MAGQPVAEFGDHDAVLDASGGVPQVPGAVLGGDQAGGIAGDRGGQPLAQQVVILPPWADGEPDPAFAAFLGAAAGVFGDEQMRENTDDWGATEPAEPLPPGQLQLIEDLRQMTEWWHIRGRGDQALFQIVIEDGAPEQLQDAVSRINSLTAADLTPQRIPPDPLLDLTTVLGAFDERQMTVLRDPAPV